MWRKAMVALFAMAALGLLVPEEAAAARRGYGAGYRTAGVHVAGVRAYPGYRPWRRYAVAPFATAAVVGAGLAYASYPYSYSYYDDPYTGYGYYPSYYGDGVGGFYGFGGCGVIHEPILTAEGWVMQPRRVCN